MRTLTGAHGARAIDQALRSCVVALVWGTVVFTSGASAQTITDGRVWWNMTLQERPGTESPWRWYFELQGRTRDGVEDNDQLLVRPAVGYDLTPRSSLWVGHGYTPSFPATGDVLTETAYGSSICGPALAWGSRCSGARAWRSGGSSATMRWLGGFASSGG